MRPADDKPHSLEKRANGILQGTLVGDRVICGTGTAGGLVILAGSLCRGAKSPGCFGA